MGFFLISTLVGMILVGIIYYMLDTDLDDIAFAMFMTFLLWGAVSFLISFMVGDTIGGESKTVTYDLTIPVGEKGWFRIDKDDDDEIIVYLRHQDDTYERRVIDDEQTVRVSRPGKPAQLIWKFEDAQDFDWFWRTGHQGDEDTYTLYIP